MAVRWQSEFAVDLNIAWQRKKMGIYMQIHFPALSRNLADTAVSYMVRKQWGKFDPTWRIQPSPSITLTLLAVSETLISFFREREITSRMEFDDLEVLAQLSL